jgi:hypothetical protein
MQYKVISVVGCLILCASAFSQDQPRELRSDGHLLGETAEQFFSEGFVGDTLRACQASDWKTVSKNVGHKTNAKDYCAKEKVAKQQATSGTRLEYDGHGDEETMRVDTFTFDGGHLVKFEMAYIAPVANTEGFHPKSYGELFAGLEEAYGPPSKSYTEPVLNTYGVKYEAPRAVWMGNHDIITIIEQPGQDARTRIIAETLAEYNRSSQAPKTPNPLQ